MVSEYRSKIDAWLMAVILAAFVAIAIALVQVWAKAGGVVEAVLFSLLALAPMALLASLVLATVYRLDNEWLDVRSGPFRWRVRLAALDEVVPTRNPLASPALSLDRLHVRYRGSLTGLLISPKARDRFLDDLAARAPHLERRGDRLERRERP